MRKLLTILKIIGCILIMPYIIYQICQAFKYHDDMMLDIYYDNLNL